MEKKEDIRLKSKSGVDDKGDVTPMERALLARAADGNPDSEDAILGQASLDSTDEDGLPLEEKSFKNDLSGEDLDVPGAEDDDADEAVGDEDEENNEYSLSRNNDD